MSHPHRDLIGYPITEAFEHEGWLVQYMQNTRLEVHPENEPAYFITLGWLGELSHRTQPPLHQDDITQPKTATYFPKTGHQITGEFLSFFMKNGNTVQFGRPISEPFIHQGRLVQDFQSARFIWRPDLPEGSRVQLEPLGETYFLSGDLPLHLLDPVAIPPEAQMSSRQRATLPDDATASLTIQSTPRQDVYRVVVSLLDAHKRPLSNQIVLLRWDGQTRRLPPTGGDGQTHRLVVLKGQSQIHFELYDSDQNVLLSSLTFS
ncbi:MAG: hypothetical protein AAF629_25730 [Chloroflexota bacterium]